MMFICFNKYLNKFYLKFEFTNIQICTFTNKAVMNPARWVQNVKFDFFSER